MTPSANEPLQIGAIGLDDRQRNALRMVFDGVCRKAYRFAEDAAPEVWIVDLDQIGAATALTGLWRTHGRRPVLFLALNTPGDISIDGCTVQGMHLRKPFRVDELVAALARLGVAARAAASVTAPVTASATAPATASVIASATASVIAPTRDRRVDAGRMVAARQSARVARLLDDEATHSLVGNAPDVDLDNPAQHAQIYYAPDRYLQGRVVRAWRRATETGRPLAVEGPWPELVLFPAENKVQISAAAREYRRFAMVPDLQGESSETRLDVDQASFGDCLPYPVFMWKLALWAARGRLPAGTPLDIPVFLRHWPNFPRLDVSPSALAIAALWSREPHSLAWSVQVLGVPQRWVFAFYSASRAIELAGVTRRAVDRMFVPQALPPQSKLQHLLGRVLDKLRRPAAGT